MDELKVIEETASSIVIRTGAGYQRTYFKNSIDMTVKLTSARIHASASRNNHSYFTTDDLSQLQLTILAKGDIVRSSGLVVLGNETSRTTKLTITIVCPTDDERKSLHDWEVQRGRAAPSRTAATITYADYRPDGPEEWQLRCWLNPDIFNYAVYEIQRGRIANFDFGVSSPDFYSTELVYDNDEETIFLRTSSFKETQSVGALTCLNINSREVPFMQAAVR